MKGVLKRVKTNLSRRYSAVAEADERQVTEVDLEILDDAEPDSSDAGNVIPTIRVVSTCRKFGGLIHTSKHTS